MNPREKLQGWRRKTMTRQSACGQFKYSRFFLILAYERVFPILLLLLTNVLTDEAWWLSGSGVCSVTNKTWVRIPGPPYALLLFFYRLSSANPSAGPIIQPHSIKRQMAQGQIWWSQMMVYHGTKSTSVYGSPEVNQACANWATKLLIKPLFQAQTS